MRNFLKRKKDHEEKPVVNEIDTGIKNEKRIKKIINICFIVIVVLLCFITIDVICVSKYQVGPFFAIKTKTYKDGGSKEYYGIGYKVIKYHQKQGRRDIVLGTWSMPYNIEPITTTALDLAIEFRNRPEKTYKKYAGQFLRVSGDVLKADGKNKTITMRYKDPDDKYTLEIICEVENKKKIVTDYKNGDSLTAIGSVTKFEMKTEKEPYRLYMKHCFVK